MTQENNEQPLRGPRFAAVTLLIPAELLARNVGAKSLISSLLKRWQTCWFLAWPQKNVM